MTRACVWIAMVGALVLSARLAHAAPDTIPNWLECEECSDGELAAVVALGPSAVPELATILRDGMPPAARKELERQLNERYAARAAYAARHNTQLVLSRNDYVAHHLGTRDSLYRVRAAIALGRIATPDARAALEAARDTPQRPSVEQAIKRALAPL